MAFQPILDTETGAVFAYEALVRGVNGEGAGAVLSMVSDANRYAFDQSCRVKALEIASKLGLGETGAMLSINFLPNAVYDPRACIRLTLETARRLEFPPDKIMFEFTENETLDAGHVTKIVQEYRALGFKVALDDFGAGHSGLGLLSRIQPQIVKFDMGLIRGIDTDARKQTILKHTVAMLKDLDIMPIAEGIETHEELEVVNQNGIVHVQGYLFGRPAFEMLERPIAMFA